MSRRNNRIGNFKPKKKPHLLSNKDKKKKRKKLGFPSKIILSIYFLFKKIIFKEFSKNIIRDFLNCYI